jgi:hypothetical protein
LKFLNPLHDGCGEDITIGEDEDFGSVESACEQSFFIKHTRLELGIQEDVIEITGPALIPTVGAATGEHLRGETFEEDYVGLGVGDLHERGAEGFDNVADESLQFITCIGIGVAVASRRIGFDE